MSWKEATRFIGDLQCDDNLANKVLNQRDAEAMALAAKKEGYKFSPKTLAETLTATVPESRLDDYYLEQVPGGGYFKRLFVLMKRSGWL
ncbi:Nif11-like leader peptide family natural product precursor [Salidesulfovibrio brasiliensis]|uniref:Nif11-like leader peptide family natural product precursor n=1 Tax=Salidesulfovibrio brasiliensis TaxID=221711 RepID=UPI0006D08D23|nr:Nif11-like leader peptide family natural product precursor [Salidesulfovibrio brasiliensis]